MQKYFFMQRVLKFIGEGALFSRICASALRVFAVLTSIGALVAWMQLWKLVFHMSGAAILGGVLFQGVFVVGAYMVVHTLWIRAADIRAIGSSEFTIIPIVSIFLRMLGEVYACISVAAGVGGGVLQLFAGYSVLASRAIRSVPGMGWEQSLFFGLFGGDSTSSFVSAFMLMVSGVIGAVFWLALFYLASEFIVVLVDIARNTRALREIVERHTQSHRNP
jgi:hypothetical protein